MDRVMQLLDLRRFDQARAAAARLLVQDPDNAVLLRLLGRALDGCGEGEAAEEAFRRSVAMAPEDASSHWWLARQLYTLKRLPEALAEADEVVRLDPMRASGHRLLALIRLASPRTRRRAMAAAQEAVRLAPHDAESWVTVGQVHARGRQRTQARRAFEEALRLDPMNTGARTGLALSSSSPNGAIASTLGALRDDPNSVLAKRGLHASLNRWAVMMLTLGVLLARGGTEYSPAWAGLVAAGVVWIVISVVAFRFLPAAARASFREAVAPSVHRAWRPLGIVVLGAGAATTSMIVGPRQGNLLVVLLFTAGAATAVYGCYRTVMAVREPRT